MTHDDPDLLTDIRDFTALFYVILRRKSSEWLESSMQSDLDKCFIIISHYLVQPTVVLCFSNPRYQSVSNL